VIGWIAIGVLTFVRPSWIVLLPVWAIATTRHSRGSVIAAAIVSSVLVGATILLAYSSTTAPYDGGFFFLRAASLSLGIESLVDNVMSNVRRLGMLDQFHPIELLERYQYAALLLAATVAVVAARWTRRSLNPHFATTAVVLALAFAAMLTLYQFTNYAEHRVLSAYLLFGTMLCLAAPGRIGPTLAAGIVIVSVANARTSLVAIEDLWRPHFVWDRLGISELERALDGTVVYRPGASRWCNTLLASQYPPQLIAVPAGIGLSVVRKPEKVAMPPRSRYLLLDEPMRTAFTGELHLDLVATLPYGKLYLNRDSECD